eukprot:gnl/MRDRNA2_/MRDRNA2_28559_c0_seq1.p1 gnl/MRDRNA2_/MRDRNA2_28559_c0~~gnl/MRDRNA2_/MRDRNA2_28559_c0_seq1.p1  ORF type:complete len:300 (+),score=59.73 gnl/MRDRNA2_/MRDRNA2_28559_c0_seq1:46-900(+)
MAHMDHRPFGNQNPWNGRGAFRANRTFVGRLKMGVKYALWNPETHLRFPKPFQRIVLLLMLCARRPECWLSNVSDEVLFWILNMCRWDSPPNAEKGLPSRKKHIPKTPEPYEFRSWQGYSSQYQGEYIPSEDEDEDEEQEEEDEEGEDSHHKENSEGEGSEEDSFSTPSPLTGPSSATLRVAQSSSDHKGKGKGKANGAGKGKGKERVKGAGKRKGQSKGKNNHQNEDISQVEGKGKRTNKGMGKGSSKSFETVPAKGKGKGSDAMGTRKRWRVKDQGGGSSCS